MCPADHGTGEHKLDQRLRRTRKASADTHCPSPYTWLQNIYLTGSTRLSHALIPLESLVISCVLHFLRAMGSSYPFWWAFSRRKLFTRSIAERVWCRLGGLYIHWHLCKWYHFLTRLIDKGVAASSSLYTPLIYCAIYLTALHSGSLLHTSSRPD